MAVRSSHRPRRALITLDLEQLHAPGPVPLALDGVLDLGLLPFLCIRKLRILIGQRDLGFLDDLEDHSLSTLRLFGRPQHELFPVWLYGYDHSDRYLRLRRVLFFGRLPLFLRPLLRSALRLTASAAPREKSDEQDEREKVCRKPLLQRHRISSS